MHCDVGHILLCPPSVSSLPYSDPLLSPPNYFEGICVTFSSTKSIVVSWKKMHKYKHTCMTFASTVFKSSCIYGLLSRCHNSCMFKCEYLQLLSFFFSFPYFLSAHDSLHSMGFFFLNLSLAFQGLFSSWSSSQQSMSLLHIAASIQSVSLSHLTKQSKLDALLAWAVYSLRTWFSSKVGWITFWKILYLHLTEKVPQVTLVLI